MNTSKIKRGRTNIIEAGPGTGKSTTTIDNLKYAASHWGVPESQILVVTFSNKLAAELTTRLRSIGLTKVETRTQHAFGAALVREDFRRFGFTQAPTPMDESEERALFEAQYNRFPNLPVDPGVLYEAFQALCERNTRVSTTLERKGVSEAHIGRARRFLRHFQKVKKKRNVLGFDDMVRLPLREMDDPDFRAKIKKKIRLLAVDEYQDMSGPQRKLIHQLVEIVDTSLIVGDDLQSIYAFRGASNRAMEELREHVPDAHHIELDKSYRLTVQTARFVNRVLDHNGMSTKIRGTGQGPVPQIVCSVSRNQMFTRAVKTIKRLKSSGTMYRDMAVLAPTNKTAHQLARFLEHQRIPFRYEGRMASDTVRRFQRFLSTLDPLNRSAMTQLLVEEVGVDVVQAQAMAKLDLNENIPAQVLGLTDLQRRHSLWFRRAIRLAREAPHVDRVLTAFDKFFLGREAYTPKSIKHVLRVHGVRLNTSLARLQEGVGALLSTEGQRRGVTVITIHGAKGAEWKNVLVLDVYDQAFGGDKEDKVTPFNLFYVAMTRPKVGLHLFTLKHEGPYKYYAIKAGNRDRPLNDKARKDKYQTLRFLPPYKTMETHCKYRRCKRPVSIGRGSGE